MLEERKVNLGQLQDLKVENSTLRADSQQSREGLDAVEKEFRRLQDKHRELLVGTQELKEERDRFQVEARSAEEKLRIAEKQGNKTQDGWERERANLEARMAGLIKQVDKMRNDPTTSKEGVLRLKEKVNEYKRKVKLANQVIAKISQKVGIVPTSDELLGPQASGFNEREINQLQEDITHLNRDLKVA